MRWLGLLVASLAVIAVGANAIAYTARAFAVRRLPECDREEPLGWLDAARAFACECWSTLLVVILIPFGWLMPRRTGRPGQRGAVVLLHGSGLNRGCWLLIRRRLRRDGWGPLWSFDYASFSADVERAAAQLATFIEAEPARAVNQPLTLIGHGLGGLVIRHYLRRHRAGAVRRVVTIGTPHGGTTFRPLPGPLRWRLAPDSPLISQLAAADRLPKQFDVIAIASMFDALILPPTSARYPEGFTVQVRDVGHYHLLFSHRIYSLLKENLATSVGR